MTVERPFSTATSAKRSLNVDTTRPAADRFAEGVMACVRPDFGDVDDSPGLFATRRGTLPECQATRCRADETRSRVEDERGRAFFVGKAFGFRHPGPPVSGSRDMNR